ncbi:MAG: hypothetical protein Q4B15_09305, partial [Lachnospiraceae bacterium]|nr:hypothetical protein [Lachnospiraceae bacterium]
DTKPTDGKEDTKPSDGKTDSKPTDEKPEKSDAFDPKTDMKVQMGSTMRTVSFKINKDVVTEEELKAAGYTVNGGVATKDTICETATYTFTKLPKTLEEIKSIPLNDRFAPMAASICAVAAFDDEKYGVSYMYSHPIFEMLDYLNGPAFEINNTQRSGIFLSMRDAVKGSYKNAYFDGANPENNYTPNTPYTFTLVESPYYIPAKSSTINYPSGTPERRMILIAFAGDDFQRYIDTYQSSDGNWYGWDNSWQHLVAEVKTMKGKDVTF